MATVSDRTMSARAIDRVKPPAKSPVRSCWNNAENHRRETPFIGKVSPPVGPWKDNTKIADMGPYRNATNNAKKADSA